MKLKSLEDLLVGELQDLYDAERRITKALPKMAKKASSPELKAAFEEHLEVTEGQIGRLDQAFERLGQKAKGKTCEAMKGIIEEGEDMMSEDADPEVCDAALIASAQKVEHYEIASYGTVRTYAQTLGHDSVAQLLAETLQEEKDADRKLTSLAEGVINQRAAAGETDQE